MLSFYFESAQSREFLRGRRAGICKDHMKLMKSPLLHSHLQPHSSGHLSSSLTCSGSTCLLFFYDGIQDLQKHRAHPHLVTWRKKSVRKSGITSYYRYLRDTMDTVSLPKDLHKKRNIGLPGGKVISRASQCNLRPPHRHSPEIC